MQMCRAGLAWPSMIAELYVLFRSSALSPKRANRIQMSLAEIERHRDLHQAFRKRFEHETDSSSCSTPPHINLQSALEPNMKMINSKSILNLDGDFFDANADRN